MLKKYDIIVVGAGHAGCEAAAAAANMGSNVLLITMNMLFVGQMSCNPSIGGIAKGQIVREIDALGGMTGIIADKTTIQFRMLNKSKGPAMWSPRTQNDRTRFSWEWRLALEKISNIDFWQDAATDIILKNGRVAGVKTSMGIKFLAKAVVLANGTFLNGKIYIGNISFTGGRIGESASFILTENLIKKGLKTERMKTGTPVRVDGRSLDFSKMDEQPGDKDPGKFSFLNDIHPVEKQKSCFLTYTSTEVHDILKTGFEKSPLFTGRIKGRGPRYCPSIEDKIERFASKERHQLFIEPEGWDTVEYYVNGFSSSLPLEIQFKALKKVAGFKNARFLRPGYAIEYDYFPPYQLKFTLETKEIENLFLAGQINGTTGYEEAAGQGLLAGINAHQKINEKQGIILKRSEAYIGVLIDDLIVKGTDEPYRMFTSRAEYRTLLRQDNADQRLTHIGRKIGLGSKERYAQAEIKKQKIEELESYIHKISVDPKEINEMLVKKGTEEASQRLKLSKLLLRPQIGLNDMINASERLNSLFNKMAPLSREILEETEVRIKYEPYIQKEKELADKMLRLENIPLETDLDYNSISSLSIEAREKLNSIRPVTIGQASRISGVSPSDIAILIVLKGH